LFFVSVAHAVVLEITGTGGLHKTLFLTTVVFVSA
jgi:hypothetical protein